MYKSDSTGQIKRQSRNYECKNLSASIIKITDEMKKIKKLKKILKILLQQCLSNFVYELRGVPLKMRF